MSRSAFADEAHREHVRLRRARTRAKHQAQQAIGCMRALPATLAELPADEAEALRAQVVGGGAGVAGGVVTYCGPARTATASDGSASDQAPHAGHSTRSQPAGVSAPELLLAL